MKRLIVCCDGTWNTPDQKDRGVMRPTNVVKIARMILPQASDGTEQRVNYDRGVGTGDFIDRMFGGMFGVGLKYNVVVSYAFLSENYDVGDEIWLFGFSRGAYTARRIVGLMRKCGLLPKTLNEQARAAAIDEAYGIFTRRESADQGGADSAVATAFRDKYNSPRVHVHCIGVWDTVGSYGIGGVLGQLSTGLSSTRFHDARLSADVKHAFHAIGIDEQRRLFQPTLWEQTPNGMKAGQQLEQSWFVGVHSNIGGGYEDTGLSDITLYWMAARAERLGLALDLAWRASLRPDLFGEVRDSRTGIYKFLGKAVRDIGVQENGFEQAHHTPFERLQRDPTPYEPENLTAYLQAGRPKRPLDFSDP